MPTGGSRIKASDIAALPKGLIAYHERTANNITATVGATETMFVRLTGIPVRAGYTYRVTCPRNTMLTTVAASTVGITRLRTSTSGAAGVTDTQMQGAEVRAPLSVDSSQVPELPMIGLYRSPADATLSIAWTIQRAVGSGSVGLYATSGAAASIWVEEIGPTPTDAGTDL
jgi:hypothetical protein